MAKPLKNLILFKLGWIACVVFAAQGLPALSAAAVAVVVGIHLLGAPAMGKEALLLTVAAAMGIVWESLLTLSGLVSYPTAPGIAGLAPYWIVTMWVLFATTINGGLAWVKRHWGVAAIAGGLGGPMAFAAGAGMGAVAFSNQWLSLTVIGLGWAILLPVLSLVSEAIADSTWLEPGYEESPEPNSFPAYLRRYGQGI